LLGTFWSENGYIEIETLLDGKAGRTMQIVVVKSPKCLRGILRMLFGIKKES
jgi:hypothetical protein